MNKIIYSKFSSERAEKFQIRTDILKNGNDLYVRKVPTSKESFEHINHMRKTYDVSQDIFRNSFIQYNKCSLDGSFLYLEFVKGITLENLLLSYVEQNDLERVFSLINKFIDEIGRSFSKERFEQTDEFCEVFGSISIDKEMMASTYLDIDMIFSNIVIENDKWYVLDYEWVFDFPVPFNFVVYRCIHQFGLVCSDINPQIEQQLFSHFNIDEKEQEIYFSMELSFQNYVKGYRMSVDDFCTEWNQQYLIDENEILNRLSCQIFYDYGEGFKEEQSYRVDYENIHEKIMDLCIDVPEGIISVRVDPCDKKCLVNLVDIYGISLLDKRVSIPFHSNGLAIEMNAIVFAVDDPIIYFDTENLDLKKLVVKFEVIDRKTFFVDNYMKEVLNVHRELRRNRDLVNIKDGDIFQLNRKLEEVTINLECKENELENTQKILDGIYNSKSWKLTGILRKAVSLIRRGNAE